jgi:hypothetical protein
MGVSNHFVRNHHPKRVRISPRVRCEGLTKELAYGIIKICRS